MGEEEVKNDQAARSPRNNSTDTDINDIDISDSNVIDFPEGLLDKQTENLKSPEKMKSVAATSSMSALEDEATPSEPVGAERA